VHRELPVTFVSFTQDLALPPGPGFWHPGMTGRLNGATVTQVDGDHEILLTAPELLADALRSAVPGARAKVRSDQCRLRP